MRSVDKNTIRMMAPAIIAVACVVVVALSVNAIVALARTVPRVGDIVTFPPSTAVAMDDTTRLVVRRNDSTDCILDLSILRRSGGSIVVDTRIGGEEGDFRVHWAGPRTSAGGGNCGSDAELIIDHRDLDILALSAGGYGIGPKQIPVFSTYVSN